MAIDMLENNELSALAPTRLGMKNFINDKPIRGKKMRNIEENFANLSGARKKLVARIKGKWSSLPQDCESIENSIALVEQDTASLIKQSATLKGYKLKSVKLIIQENQLALGELKKVQITNCASFESEKLAKEEKKFEEKLVALSESSIAKAKGEAESLGSKVKSNKNILLIGGGIVVLGVISYFIFRKK
jgi:hypothetical protein